MMCCINYNMYNNNNKTTERTIPKEEEEGEDGRETAKSI